MKTTYSKYLLENGYTPRVVKRYGKVVDAFLLENEKVKNYNYSDIVRYLDGVYKYTPSPHMRLSSYLPIKKYYDFLLETGQRETHPCRNLFVKSPRKKGIAFGELFSTEQLQLLLNRQEKFPHLRAKNRLIVSLLIYQGLLSKEIVSLKKTHVDLDKGTVFIKGGKINASRSLELAPVQNKILSEYLADRKRLLQTGKEDTDYLILNFRGRPITTDDVYFAIETQKSLFPDRILNPKTIRDSVIANLLNERGLPAQQVQLFCGHRWISSTQRYIQQPPQGQREIMNKFHPWG